MRGRSRSARWSWTTPTRSAGSRRRCSRPHLTAADRIGHLVEAAAMSRGATIRSARFLAASTSLRILLAPVVVALVLADGTKPHTSAAVAAVLFCIAAATDWIDGRLARRWGVTTKLG